MTSEQYDKNSRDLRGKVAVVAGATRGAGRGIALALGAAGAIVYCTGRSVRGQRSDLNRPETIAGLSLTSPPRPPLQYLERGRKTHLEVPSPCNGEGI